MTMKKTIKRILKEEVEGNGFTRYEIKILNWIYDKLNGESIDKKYKYGGVGYVEFLSDFKKLFGLTNKMVVDLVSLYDSNLTGERFTERNDVIRNKPKKWRVTYYRDVSAWTSDTYDVYAIGEDDAIKMVDTDLNNYKTNDKFIEKHYEGDIETGDVGDVYDTEVEMIGESIKKHLNLLKESPIDKIPKKLIIKACKGIDDIMDGNGYEWSDIEDTWSGGEEYSNLLDYVMSHYGLSSDMSHYIIAIYGENHDNFGSVSESGDVWDTLFDNGVILPKKERWKGTKQFGETRWVELGTNIDAYSKAEANFYDYDGTLDWSENWSDTNDTWDEKITWEK